MPQVEAILAAGCEVPFTVQPIDIDLPELQARRVLCLIALYADTLGNDGVGTSATMPNLW